MTLVFQGIMVPRLASKKARYRSNPHDRGVFRREMDRESSAKGIKRGRERADCGRRGLERTRSSSNVGGEHAGKRWAKYP